MSIPNKKNKENSYKKRVGIKEIAEITGLSVSTVARALRGDTAASHKTSVRVISIAKELCYYPDNLARGLRKRKTNTIGVIFNDMNNPFYSEILSTINTILNEHSFSMLVSYSHWNSVQEKTNIINMLSRRVDGIIISPVNDKGENINLLIKNNIHSVLIDSYPYFEKVNYVYIDHKIASTLSTEYLINNGHKNILLVIMSNDNLTNQHFLKGYQETLIKNNIKFREELVIKAPSISIKCGFEIFNNLITYNKKDRINFSAIVTISDLIAVGIYEAINKLGLNIPKDYSIIGYDNIEFSHVISPPLTTVHQPRKRIGELSANILLERIEKGNTPACRKQLNPEIIIRKSVQERDPKV